MSRFYKLICFFATCLAFSVVLLGAYVRLSHAGLGCPDWPGCYGHLNVPQMAQVSPEHLDSFQPAKAWKEMIHRYLAGSLALSVLLIAALSLWRKLKRGEGSLYLPFSLLGLIFFQAALGMWTVTLKLHPLVVMSHLLGGFATFSFLVWLSLKESQSSPSIPRESLQPLALGVIVIQIALGGWVSSNYAALACPDFPFCQGKLWPEMQWREAFTLWRDFGINYEYGILHNQVRSTIHMIHRLGALVAFLIVGGLGLRLKSLRLGKALLLLLVAQILLGISNVVFMLPLPIAIAHNGVAALLLATLVAINVKRY